MQEDLVENLCGIIGILMMRTNVEELVFPVEELRAMTMNFDGRTLEFVVENGTMIARLIAEDDAQPGARQAYLRQ